MAPTATTPNTINTTPSDHHVKAVKPSKVRGSNNSEPPLIDLYSGSQASVAITDEALRRDIISGLRGSQTYIIPGDVDSKEDRRFAFRR
jgi:hypothetical protein